MIIYGTINHNDKDYQTITIDGTDKQWSIAETALLRDMTDEDGAPLEDDFDKIDQGICYYSDVIKQDLDEAELLNRLIEENPDYFNEEWNKGVVRRCATCGKVIMAGYMDNESDWHACSDECCDKYYREHYGENAQKQREEDCENDACFYTEWDSPFYGQ